MNKFYVGWSEVNITPDKKVFLAGQFATRVSQYVEKPITATAMAVEAGGEQFVIISADLVRISCNLIEAVRASLAGNPMGLDPNKVIITCIHTHTGPSFTSKNQMAKAGVAYGLMQQMISMLPPGKEYVLGKKNVTDPDVISDEEAFDFLVKKLSQVARDAWNNRRPGGFSNAFGRAAVGMCRRAVYNDGSAKMWGDTNTATFRELEGGNDSGIELLFVYGDNGELTGIVANLACPAQCVQHRLFVSPDFWGEVKMLLREKFGPKLFLLPLCSPAGDQCPVDLVRWVEPESDTDDPNITHTAPLKRKADPSMFDIAGMKMVGRRIVREIIDIYEDGVDPAWTEGKFVHQVRTLSLPLRRVTPKEVEAATAAINDYFSKLDRPADYNDAANLQRYFGVIIRGLAQERINVIPTEVHVVRMGPIAIATNPFELFLDYGNQIRARSKAEQTFLIQLACGSEGYLPTEKAERGGHYSGFVGSGCVGHEGGDQLVRQTLTEIEELFKEA